MDCRTFRNKLEDYLEDGLDFAGRFGMERHAQQCINCGKTMADAAQIRQMMSGLNRVQAPPNFETSITNEIAQRRLRARTFSIRRLWGTFAGDRLWRNLAVASSGLAILAVGIFVSFQYLVPPQDSAYRAIAEKPAVSPAETIAAGTYASLEPASQRTDEVAGAAMQPALPAGDFVLEKEPAEADYVEHLVVGADGRPVTIQLPMPRKIHLNYSQISDEYFIQNVSH